MAIQEGTAKSGLFMVISILPDVCKSPVVPIPYPIVGFLEQSAFTSPNVRFKGAPAFHMGSRILRVIGDEAGTGGGLVSGVQNGFCRPIVPVPTVRCNGQHLCRHEHSTYQMNCATPESPGNTVGKVVFLGAMASASVGPGGTLPPGANPIVAAEAPGEIGCLPKLGDLGSVADGGIADMVGLAQTAYNLAQTDLSNPAAVLGAIGGLAGLAGPGGLSQAASLVRNGIGLANADWSNPGAAIGAAMGMAGPLLGFAESPGTGGASGLGDTLIDGLGKLWNLPNTLLGSAIGLAGYTGQELYYQFRNLTDAIGLWPNTESNPSIGFGHNGIEFSNNLFGLEGAAITLGNAIIYGPKTPGGRGGPDEHGTHEQQHTYQGETLGPLYLPAWLTGAVVAGMQWKNPFGTGNFMESGPYDHPPHPWP